MEHISENTKFNHYMTYGISPTGDILMVPIDDVHKVALESFSPNYLMGPNKSVYLRWIVGYKMPGEISELAKLLNYDFSKFMSEDGSLLPFEDISSEIEAFNRSQLLT